WVGCAGAGVCAGCGCCACAPAAHRQAATVMLARNFFMLPLRSKELTFMCGGKSRAQTLLRGAGVFRAGARIKLLTFVPLFFLCALAVVLCDDGVELLLLLRRQERTDARARLQPRLFKARAQLRAQGAITLARLVEDGANLRGLLVGQVEIAAHGLEAFLRIVPARIGAASA